MDTNLKTSHRQPQGTPAGRPGTRLADRVGRTGHRTGESGQTGRVELREDSAERLAQAARATLRIAEHRQAARALLGSRYEEEIAKYRRAIRERTALDGHHSEWVALLDMCREIDAKYGRFDRAAAFVKIYLIAAAADISEGSCEPGKGA